MFGSIVHTLFAAHALIINCWNSLFDSYSEFSDINNVGAGIIYVNAANENIDQDGTSWAKAFSSLSDALNVASDKTSIWIAKGTYYPSETNDRSDTFLIPYGMGLYGGFQGTEKSKNERKYPLPASILSGNIGDPNDKTDNSYHVVTLAHQTVTLDGLTISDGYAMYEGHSRNADCFGGGLYIPKVSNIQTEHIRPTLSNMTFYNNSATNGGAIFAFTNVVLKISDSIFLNNKALNGEYHDGMGGAIYISYNGVLEVYNSEFEYNSADAMGGAVMLDYGCTGVIHGNYFRYNQVDKGNGGALGAFDRDSQMGKTEITVNDCIFEYNNANNGYGGAIWLYDGAMYVDNIILCYFLFY